ncbi:MAG: GNAT family N-acetyltransferase [Planctomycetota bacterium]
MNNPAPPTPVKPKQLQMLWPASRLAAPPAIDAAPGYSLRIFEPADAAAYIGLMHKAGFKDWNAETLAATLKRILPDGLFVIEHMATGSLAATTMAIHNPTDLHPFGGELGWVAGDPAHSGKGLGMTVCAAVVDRYLRAGYKCIYLQTDDWRLPAIKVYLKLGFVPYLFAPDMAGRWQAVCAKLDWPVDPAWPTAR